MNLSSAKNILIIRLSSLGDILLATPLIRTIKEIYADIKLDFLLKEQYKDVLIRNPYLNNLFLYPDNEKDIQNLIKDFKERNYDLIIDLQNNLRSKRIRNSFNSSKVIFHKRDLEKFLLVYFKINLLKQAPPIPERYAATLNQIKLDEKGLDLLTNEAASPLFEPDKKYIGFCPGSMHFTKMWPKEYYIKLGNLLKKDGYNIILFGGKEDRNICEEISLQIPCSINLSNHDDILQTAADMKMCNAIVCNDSGLMHAACALKIPVLTFFGSTVKEFGFLPYKNKSIILENSPLSCRPCTHIGKSYCPKGHFKCMLELIPEIAFEKLKLLLT